MLALQVFIALFIAALARLIWKRWRFLQLRSEIGVPGPRTRFFSGNMITYLIIHLKYGRESHPKVHGWFVERYGKTFGLYHGGHLDITSVDIDFAQEILVRQFANFADRQTLTINNAFPMSQNLLHIGHEKIGGYAWKDIRSIVSPTFTTGKMKRMHPTVHERINVFLDCLGEKVDKCGGKPIEIYDDWQALTLDVIGRCAFAATTDPQRNRKDTFYVNCQRFIASISLEKSWSVVASLIFPFLGPHLRKWSRMSTAEKPLINGLRAILEDRKKNFETFQGVDLIQLLLQQDQERQRNENKPPLSDEAIISNCFAFLLAGYETTSTSLAYTTWLLAKNPRTQEILYKEVMEKFGKDKLIDYEGVMSLPYLDAVFHESLRVLPPVLIFTTRRCINETTVCGIRIPRGVNVSVAVHGVHWSEENWPNAREFIPERFLEPSAKKNPAWMPFGMGPRNCVGMRFAEMEFKTAIASIVRSFKLELENPNDDLKTTMSIILMRPLNGVHVVVSRR